MSQISDFSASVVRGFRRVFTERQFYLRSHGQVQFMALSGWTQVALSFGALIFLGWVGYTSVNVVFQQEIIASKDRKYVQMQSAYERRIAEMQASYDELNGAMVLAQERFLETTSELETKHQRLANLLNHSLEVRGQLDDMRKAVAELGGDIKPAGNARETRLLLRPAPVEGAVRESRVPVTSPAFGGLGDRASLGSSVSLAQNADGLRHDEKVALMDLRLESLEGVQNQLVNRVEEETDIEIKEIESIIRLTGFDPDDLATRMDIETTGFGGPFINLADSAAVTDDEEASDFSRQLFRVSTNLDRISVLNQTLRQLPIARPVYGVELTSNFGPRVDPFKKSLAFHSGVDFAGAYGTPVFAPMAGTVTWANWRSSYGKMVEIDHGNGIKTRYAHLSRISVKKGDRVEFRETIGKIGSTGRSTGPHLHYEVWVDGKVQNPAKFLKAGQYVLEEG